jgi:hypothetical protein
VEHSFIGLSSKKGEIDWTHSQVGETRNAYTIFCSKIEEEEEMKQYSILDIADNILQ